MSRWLIAVFALYFLSSVLLSTLGLAQPRALAPQASSQPAQALDTASLLDDFGHALMDDQQDLPDILHESPEIVRCAAAGCARVAGPVPDRLSHALAPPDKPPSA